MSKASKIAFEIRKLVYGQVSRAEMPEKLGFTSDEFEEFLRMRHWTKIEEERPEHDGMYLCRLVFGGLEDLNYFYGRFYSNATHLDFDNAVTHWMELPEVPE